DGADRIDEGAVQVGPLPGALVGQVQGSEGRTGGQDVDGREGRVADEGVDVGVQGRVQELFHAGLVRALPDEGVREVPLGVRVNKQDTALALVADGCEQPGRDRLADPALQIE